MTNEERERIAIEKELLGLPSEEIGTSDDPMLWEELNRMDLPEQEWLIKGLVTKGGFTILAAVAGEKKTWVALSMAKSIADGTYFLDNPSFATTQGPVLYLDLEMPRRILRKRCRLLGIKENAQFWICNGRTINLNTDEGVEWLFRTIKAFKICAVFIDTLRGSSGGMKEEKAEEVRKFFDRLQPLKNMGIGVIIVDHFRKPARHEGTVPKKEFLFGSQDKTAAVEIVNMIKSEKDSLEIEFHQVKNRVEKELKPFKIDFCEDLDEYFAPKTIKLKYGGQMEEDEFMRDRAGIAIVSILKEGGKTRAQIIEVVHVETKVGERNISEAIRDLEGRGVIIKGKQGRQNFYTLSSTAQNPSLPQSQELFESL